MAMQISSPTCIFISLFKISPELFYGLLFYWFKIDRSDFLLEKHMATSWIINNSDWPLQLLNNDANKYTYLFRFTIFIEISPEFLKISDWQFRWLCLTGSDRRRTQEIGDGTRDPLGQLEGWANQTPGSLKRW